VTSSSSVPVSAPEAEETAEAALQRRLAAAHDSGEEFTAFTRYSSERCAKLNSDGHSWDCPEDSLGLVPSDEALAAAGQMLDELLEDVPVQTCQPDQPV